jgi:hypothetical protein
LKLRQTQDQMPDVSNEPAESQQEF